MRRAISGGVILALLVWPALGSPAPAGASTIRRYHNPVFAKPFPDPMVLRVGPRDYWAYGTSLGWNPGYFPILYSRDLVHWRYQGDLFPSVPSWVTGDTWAPDVVRRGGTYYAYFTGMSRAGMHCIGVATASRPGGPFRSRGMVACHGTTTTGFIDPDLFIDRNGKAYLYVSVDDPPHSIGVIPMKPNLLRPAGPITLLFGVSQAWERAPGFTTVEGPFLVRRGGTYYLFYSGGDTGSAHYEMGYALAASPTGPFRKYGHNPILRETKKVPGPGGGSVVRGPDGRWWMVYHAWSGHVGFAGGDTRTMRIDPIRWRGGIPRVTPHA